MAKELDCSLNVSDFKLQSRYFLHFRTKTFGKDMNSLIPLVMSKIESILFNKMDGFGIK